MSKIIKKIIAGVGMGCFVYVCWILFSSLTLGAEEFFSQTTASQFLLNIAYFTMITLGFYVSSIIYENDAMNLKLEVLIHMLIGGTILTIVASVAGWASIGTTGSFIYIIATILVAGLGWLITSKITDNQIERMNEKINSKDK